MIDNDHLTQPLGATRWLLDEMETCNTNCIQKHKDLVNTCCGPLLVIVNILRLVVVAHF